MEKKNIILGGAVVALSVFLSLLFGGSSTVQETIREIKELGAIPSALDVGPELGINRLQTRVVMGEFTHNGTSTIADFRNPFTATATIDFFAIRSIGVSSSTYNVQCGVMTSSTTNAFVGDGIMKFGTVSTSTDFGMVTNEMATSTNLFGSMTGTVGYGGPINITGGDLGRFKCIATHPAGYDTARIATTTPNATFQVNWWARVLYGR